MSVVWLTRMHRNDLRRREVSIAIRIAEQPRFDRHPLSDNIGPAAAMKARRELWVKLQQRQMAGL